MKKSLLLFSLTTALCACEDKTISSSVDSDGKFFSVGYELEYKENVKDYIKLTFYSDKIGKYSKDNLVVSFRNFKKSIDEMSCMNNLSLVVDGQAIAPSKLDIVQEDRMGENVIVTRAQYNFDSSNKIIASKYVEMHFCNKTYILSQDDILNLRKASQQWLQFIIKK